DIPLLVERFKDRQTIEQGLTPKKFDSSAMSVLINYDWPGNVRELLDTIESLIVLTDSDIILSDDVTTYLNNGLDDEKEDNGGGAYLTMNSLIKKYKRRIIIEAVTANNGNISAAARQLGVDRSNLHKKISDLDIDLS
ncbi:MAG: hypothetical protein GY865_20415, partial [candidate division Zixibacteria bacterium]|nr:hypothetical protein [candidate division Zixibacteria bacterium]